MRSCAYTSFLDLARLNRLGIRVLFKRQKGWRVEPDVALQVLTKRYHSHWKSEWHQPAAEAEVMARLLADHGSKKDVEFVGRWVRDTSLTSMSPLDEQLVRDWRSLNEELNAAIKT